MAITYLNAVTAHLHLKGTVKPIAVALANRANDTGACWPSIKTLSNDTGFSASTVKRSIHTLKDSGYLTIKTRTRKDGSQTSNLYKLVLESFTNAATNIVKAVKNGFSKAVEIGKQFIENQVQVVKPTSSRIGTQAWLELPEAYQQTVIDRLTSKTNPILKDQISLYGLDSSYVQKALFNEVQQFKREQKKKNTRSHMTTAEKLTDRSWAEGLELDQEV